MFTKFQHFFKRTTVAMRTSQLTPNIPVCSPTVAHYYHRLIGWFILEGILKIKPLVPNPLPWVGDFPQDQVSQSHIPFFSHNQ